MTIHQKKSTRREFIKKSAGVAGTLMLTGLTSACASSSLTDADIAKQNPPKPQGRQDYQIFSQGMIGNLPIKNRLVRSATMINAASHGEVSQVNIDMLRTLSEGGVGLIITGFMIPTQDDATNQKQVHIYHDRHIQSLRRFVDAVHEADSECRFFAQIGHSGAAVNPSGFKWPYFWKKDGRALTTEEIEGIITDHAQAVHRAKKAGFDGVELHGAHDYLLGAFLSPYMNRRTDAYGGSIENRVRIIKEIMVQSRALVGDDFPIIIKLNSEEDLKGGMDTETFAAQVEEVVKTGVDAIDVSGGQCLQKDINSIERETYFFKGAKAADVNVPVIVTGGNRTIDNMEKILKTREVSFFGMARPLIREPDLPKRWLEGRGGITADCISCNGCIMGVFSGQSAQCTQV